MSYRVFPVAVAAATSLSPGFRRLTLHAPQLSGLRWAGLDQRVKLLVGDPDALAALTADTDAEGEDGWYARWCALPEHVRPQMRTYTIAGHRVDRHEVDIDFAVHGDAGPMSRFARHARQGDRLLLVGPGPAAGDTDGLAWRPGRARHLLCVGDETALPAIRNILASLRAHQTCRVVLEVPSAADRLPLPSPARVQVDWVVRCPGEAVGAAAEAVLLGGRGRGAAAGEPDPDLWQEADSDDVASYAWVAGEVGWVNRMRALLRPAGYDRSNAAFMGYWREGHPARG